MSECFTLFNNVGLVVPAMNHSVMEQTYIGTIFTVNNLACPVLLTPFKQIMWGAFMLFKKTALNKVNNFSLDYPKASGEDIDMCFKLYESGVNIVVDKRSFIYHEWGSTGKRIYGDMERQKLYLENYEIFKKKWSHYTKNW